MATTTTPISAEQFLAIDEPGSRLELIAGEIRRMSPAGPDHGDIAMQFAWRIAQYVTLNQLGKVYAAETGFILSRNPDTVRAPDVSFVAKARVPAGKTRGFFSGPPDLAVEVLSPNDSVGEVGEKVGDWLDADTRVVIVINPSLSDVTLYRSRTDIRVFTGEDRLELPDLVPGWSISVAEIFAEG